MAIDRPGNAVVRAYDAFEVRRYDPPWMRWFLRRNEIWLELE
jgi:hypothetical protein